jgi:hypothetical protein
MITTRNFFILILVFVSFVATSQNVRTQQTEIAAKNILFGAVTSGIGSMINKPKNETIAKAFLRGSTRGMVGGVVAYTGKNLLHFVASEKKEVLAWPAKLVHTTGASIMENAGRHKGFLEVWSIENCVIRTEINTKTWKIQPRLMVNGVWGLIYRASDESRFNLSKSLMVGTAYFAMTTDQAMKGSGGKHVCGNVACFEAEGYSTHETLAHELNHAFQWREIGVFTSFLQPANNLISKKSNLYSKVSKWIYVEPDYVHAILTSIEGSRNAGTSRTYYKNYFERESESIATWKYVHTNNEARLIKN